MDDRLNLEITICDLYVLPGEIGLGHLILHSLDVWPN